MGQAYPDISCLSPLVNTAEGPTLILRLPQYTVPRFLAFAEDLRQLVRALHGTEEHAIEVQRAIEVEAKPL